MKGGISAWEGLTAEGAPEAGMAYFTDADKPEDLIILAWMLEEGTGKFYTEMPAILSDMEAVALFQDLVFAEEQHKATLVNFYKDLTNAESVPENLGALISSETPGDIMEGGISVSEALEWAKGRDMEAILEFTISLEANSLDLYIKMGRKMGDSNSKKIFDLLSKEEKKHLERMAKLLEKRVK